VLTIVIERFCSRNQSNAPVYMNTYFQSNRSVPFYKIMVPTVDSVRYNFLLDTLIRAKRPVLLTGPVGTGKTSVAQKVLESLDPKVWNVLTINMSAQVSNSICIYLSKAFNFPINYSLSPKRVRY